MPLLTDLDTWHSKTFEDMGHLLIYSQQNLRDFNCCRLQTHTFRLEDRRHCNEWLELLQLAVADVNDAEGGSENPLLAGLGAGVGLAPAAPGKTTTQRGM